MCIITGTDKSILQVNSKFRARVYEPVRIHVRVYTVRLRFKISRWVNLEFRARVRVSACSCVLVRAYVRVCDLEFRGM